MNTELRLLAQARRGDRQAFEALLAPYRERVYATAMRLMGNREDAAEIAQEAFLRTFWKITSFRGHAHFYTWLYRITLNLCYRRLEARRREPLSPNTPSPDGGEGPALEDSVPDGTASPFEVAASNETSALVRRALAALKPSDFQILVLREFEELSYEEVAARLHLPKGTVMSRLHRARLALAEQLSRLGVQPDQSERAA